MNLTQIILRKLLSTRNGLFGSNTTVGWTAVCQNSTNKSTSSSSSSSSDSDDESKKKTSNKDAASRLNLLLQQMVTESYSTAAKTINLARPKDKRAEGRTEKEKESVNNQPIEKQAIKAAKDVAEALGGNTKQTESELIMKLLSPTESQDLSNILKGMKIERDEKPNTSRAEQVRKVLQQVQTKTQHQDRPTDQAKRRRSYVPAIDQGQPESVDLFGRKPLGIFTNCSELKDSPPLKTWEKLNKKVLKLAVTHPPANYFQEMILWTEQGKLWQFPINNEFGLDKESQVYFADHIFLEDHLEPWCPPKGPIRHFMELVCVGLSKNSYLLVEEKKQHIEWYKNYFEDKRKLLLEVGAIPAGHPKTKNIENE